MSEDLVYRLWERGLPTEEGWYFHKKREATDDPFYWTTYFVMKEEDDSNRSFWQDGTDVHMPDGGWWSKINI